MARMRTCWGNGGMDGKKVARRVPWWVRAAAGVVITLWVAVVVYGFLLLRVGNGQVTITNAGQFGDFFGAINALFSGFAFIGLTYTIHMQRQELELQRKELRAQRKEMKGSNEQLKAQVEAQYALIQATIAQVKVAGIQTQAEGIRLIAEAMHDPQSIKDASRQILQYGQEIETLAEKPKSDTNKNG